MNPWCERIFSKYKEVCICVVNNLHIYHRVASHMKCVIIIRYSKDKFDSNDPKVRTFICWFCGTIPWNLFYNCTREWCSSALGLFHWNMEIKTLASRDHISMPLWHTRLFHRNQIFIIVPFPLTTSIVEMMAMWWFYFI